MVTATRIFVAVALAAIVVALVGATRSVIDGTYDLLAWQIVAAAWPVTPLIFVYRYHQITKEN